MVVLPLLKDINKKKKKKKVDENKQSFIPGTNPNLPPELGGAPKEDIIDVITKNNRVGGGVSNNKTSEIPPTATGATPLSNPKSKLDTTDPRTFRNATTGNVSGVVLPDGRTFLGLSPDEVDEILKQEKLGEAKPILPTTEEELMREGLAAELGNLPQLGGLTPTGLDRRQALIAGAQNVIPQAAGYAAAGAAAGFLGTGGTLSIPAAVVGAIGGSIKGFYEGYNSNLKSQASGIIKGRTYSLTDSEKGMRDLINMQNAKIGDPAKNLELFNEQLALIRDAYAQLKLDTNDNLNRWLDDVDGTKQLMKFQVFYDTGRDYEFIQLMNEATLIPDENRVIIYTDTEND